MTETTSTSTVRRPNRPRRFGRGFAALAAAASVAVGGIGVLTPETAQAAGLQDNRLSVLGTEPTATTTQAVDLAATPSNYAGMRLRVRADGVVENA